MSDSLNVHFMPGDGKGWALDEDRRQMRQALAGIIEESSLVSAKIIHTPFWQGLNTVAPEILKKAFVIAHADNPPFFYLKQPEFLLGQQQVDLWIARSQEALEQFRALQLPVEYIPYTIDPQLFFPIVDKKKLRKKFGIPEEAYVIANFHRDTEGADLSVPKLQKAPELMLAILKKLRDRGFSFHMLLAGPRRHWLRRALAHEKIPFTFVGDSSVEGDDFGVNILDRSTLNELTNAADLYLIPSRWEGGPQSVMEAAACQCKILSTPLGVAKDILEHASLYRSVSEAVTRIAEDIQYNCLKKTLQPQWERWQQSHTTASMVEGLQQLYKTLSPKKSLHQTSWIQLQKKQIFYTVQRRFCSSSLPEVVGWNHQPGKNADLDEVLLRVGSALRTLGISVCPATGRGVEFIGWPTDALSPIQEGSHRLQWIVPRMPTSCLLQESSFITPSVQDVINLRASGFLNPALVIPFPLAGGERSEEPFAVNEGDSLASMSIWRAMAAGRPIVYPKKSAYYEQVFHGGFAFENDEDIPRLLKIAQEEVQQLRMLTNIPSRASAQKTLKQLLENLF